MKLNLNDIRDWLNFIAEWAILIILVIEYQYDKSWNEHLKRQKKKQKARLDFESLTAGEGK